MKSAERLAAFKREFTQDEGSPIFNSLAKEFDMESMCATDIVIDAILKDRAGARRNNIPWETVFSFSFAGKFGRRTLSVQYKRKNRKCYLFLYSIGKTFFSSTVLRTIDEPAEYLSTACTEKWIEWADELPVLNWFIWDVLGLEKFVQFCAAAAMHADPHAEEIFGITHIPRIPMSDIVSVFSDAQDYTHVDSDVENDVEDEHEEIRQERADARQRLTAFQRAFGRIGGASILNLLSDDISMESRCAKNVTIRNLKIQHAAGRTGYGTKLLFALSFSGDFGARELRVRELRVCYKNDEGKCVLILATNDQGEIMRFKDAYACCITPESTDGWIRWAGESRALNWLLWEIFGVEKFIHFCALAALHGCPHADDVFRMSLIPRIEIRDLLK